MKAVVLISAVVLTLWSLPANANVTTKWANFKQLHQKTYKNRLEEVERLAIFATNLNKIEEHNKLYEKKEVTYKMGVNKFADWTTEEFVQYLNLHTSSRSRKVNAKEYERAENVVIPEQVDWRDQGAVTAVKNQGQCGSCWAFSTTGALESQNFLVTGNLVPLSEQELVDCSHQGENEGCSGGFMEDAFEYVIANGLSTEEEYPYEAKDKKCRRGNLRSAVKETDYLVLKQEDEAALQEAVATLGPIAVAVDASNWHLYEEGVFYDTKCSSVYEELNHGVLAAGYGTTEEGVEYWLVKNSWGGDWGEEGYIRTARNKKNNCGISTNASVPIL